MELDVAVYGGAHTALILARVMGLLVQQLWRAAASQPLLSLAAAAIGTLLLLDNQEDVLRKARAASAAIRDRGSRLLEASEPVFDRWQTAKGDIESRLERPMLPRTLESLCARELATQRVAPTADALLSTCGSAFPTLEQRQLVSFLKKHPSFCAAPRHTWELGRLGRSIIDA